MGALVDKTGFALHCTPAVNVFSRRADRIHVTDQHAYMKTVDPLREMDPEVILSSHLPPAVDRISECLDMLSVAPMADPWVGPDQRALEEMLAGFEPAATPPG